MKKVNQQRVKRRLARAMPRGMQEESVPMLGLGGRVLWVGLALPYSLVLRAVYMSARDYEAFHKVYCLWRTDAAYFTYKR